MRKAAEPVEQSVTETLGYHAFPEPDRRRIRTNNPLERLRGLAPAPPTFRLAPRGPPADPSRGGLPG
jgi:hypothetical protein